MTMTVDLPSLFQPSPSALPVIDPTLKQYGRLWVSFERLQPTHGLARYQGGHPYPPSLCLLFQQQRCHAGEKCNQIHVDRDFISATRILLRNHSGLDCCSSHGDLPSTRRDFQRLSEGTRLFLMSTDGHSKIPIAMKDIAVTAFWAKVISEHANGSSAAEVVITPAEICYLHQRTGCKYGTDCRHVHICRQQFPKIAAELARHLHVNTPFTAPVAISQKSPSVVPPVPAIPQRVSPQAQRQRATSFTSPSLGAKAVPELREQLMGVCLPAASKSSSSAPSTSRVASVASPDSRFVPLSSWAPRATPRAQARAPEKSPRKGVSRRASSISSQGSLSSSTSTEITTLSPASAKPLSKPSTLQEPFALLSEEGVEKGSPTSADSLAKALFCVCEEWNEPSASEEEGRRASVSRLALWQQASSSPSLRA